MKPLIFDNPFRLLAAFLSPWKDGLKVHRPDLRLHALEIDWGRLVYAANLHLCTPLWYARLKQDGLLEFLPESLIDYLQTLYQMNLARNQTFIRALEHLLIRFNSAGIDTVLLKGAACFCDNLYQAPGARISGDMDILIKSRDMEPAEDILLESGFVNIHTPGIKAARIVTHTGAHHLPRYNLPGTPVSVELHFRIGQGKSDEILSPETCWRHSLPMSLCSQRTHIPDPAFRLLHNAVHALIQDRGFIRSEMPLRQLAEFSHIVHVYQDQIDWDAWVSAGRKSKIHTQ